MKSSIVKWIFESILAAIIIFLAIVVLDEDCYAGDLRFGAGVGIGVCGGQAKEYDGHMCEQGPVTKFFLKADKEVNENLSLEVELWHLSHPEYADFHPSKFDKRTSQLNGLTANVIFWF